MLKFLFRGNFISKYFYDASCRAKKSAWNYAHDRGYQFGKRMKSTMSRYMDPELADQLMAEGDNDDIMGGKQSVGTVLFSDVRSFTTITEELRRSRYR